MVDTYSIYSLNKSAYSTNPEVLRFIVMVDETKPVLGGKTLVDVVEVLVTGQVDNGEVMGDVMTLNPDVNQDLSDYQEVDVDNMVADSRIESAYQHIGFRHDNGCGNVLINSETIAKNVLKKTSTSVALGLLMEVANQQTLKRVVEVLDTAQSVRKSSVVDWSDDITMVNGEVTCCYCGGEVHV